MPIDTLDETLCALRQELPDGGRTVGAIDRCVAPAAVSSPLVIVHAPVRCTPQKRSVRWLQQGRHG